MKRPIRETHPGRLVARLSEAKARSVAEIVPDAIIVAGDAVVSKEGVIYEKPVNAVEATRFLKEFSGQTVEFVTGLAVLNSATGKLIGAVQSSQITFRVLSDTEIADYVGRYEVLRFAGAFDADGVIRFADRVSGSYNFATGVALTDLIALLRRNGIVI
jgi:MAF protein